MTESPSIGVLMIGEGAVDDHPTGLNRYVKALAEALAGVAKVEVLAVGEGSAVAPVAFVANRQLPMPLRMWKMWRRSGCRDTCPTILDVHFAIYGLLSALLPIQKNAHLVVHFHGPWAAETAAKGGAGPAALWMKARIERAVYRRAERAIVLSDAFARVLVAAYGVDAGKVVVIPPGVDLDTFRPEAAGSPTIALPGVPAGAWIACAARRLVPRTGIDALLRAWSGVVARAPHAFLVVAGEGPEQARLESLAAQLGITDHVYFAGHVIDEDLVKIYRAAQISVVPSQSLEGFGLVVLESLACGTPVVATDVGGIPEALAGLDASLIVPVADEAALTDRLLDACLNPASLPDPSRCRAHAERFTWAETARQHLELYATLARSLAVRPLDLE